MYEITGKMISLEKLKFWQKIRSCKKKNWQCIGGCRGKNEGNKEICNFLEYLSMNNMKRIQYTINHITLALSSTTFQWHRNE